MTRALFYGTAILLWIWALVGALYFCKGEFPYSLDDAWIHLQFAENLAQGYWGIQPPTLSVPSSSILWPWLLVPFAKTAFMPWWPLVLASLCYLASLRLIEKWFREGAGFWGPWLALLTLLFSNLAGLVFTGMEHSLQVLLAILILLGLRDLGRGRSVIWWFEILLLAPLVRYEMLALVLPALLLAWWQTKRRVYLFWIPLTLAPLVLYSFQLHSLGLPALPTSVLAKSAPAAASGVLAFPQALLANLVHNLQLPQGRFLGLCLVLALALVSRKNKSAETRILPLWLAAALFLHLLAGRIGWLNRYEIQVWLPALLVLLAAFQPWLKANQQRWGRGLLPVVLSLGLFFAGLPYLRNTLETPWAVRNIHEQQSQLARFSKEFWPHPVAVNDLGRVCWRNENPVLDLWGLASPQALQARQASTGSGWAGVLCRDQGITLAMIYEDWFSSIPEDWQEIGRLQLAGKRVSADRDEVVFYLLDPQYRAAAVDSLSHWITGLPEGVRFTKGDLFF